VPKLGYQKHCASGILASLRNFGLSLRSIPTSSNRLKLVSWGLPPSSGILTSIHSPCLRLRRRRYSAISFCVSRLCIEFSRRRENLSWAHHQEVAPLEPEQQTCWFNYATERRLTSRELRAAIKGGKPNLDDAYQPNLASKRPMSYKKGQVIKIITSETQPEPLLSGRVDYKYPSHEGYLYLPIWQLFPAA